MADIIILFWIVLMTVVDGLLAFIGVFTYFVKEETFRKWLMFLVAFTTGALLGGAFFHLLPEAFAQINYILIILIALAGFFVFMLIEKFLHWRHCHDGHCEVHPVNYLILYGDSIHNFIDGLIIAAAFLISLPFGFLTSFLVLAHELPQELGDFAVLVYGGFKRNKALFYSFFAQITAIVGGILGFFFLQSYKFSAYLLPFAAGGFIYIALGDLIPELFKERNLKKIIINIIAIVLGLILLLSAKIFAG